MLEILAAVITVVGGILAALVGVRPELFRLDILIPTKSITLLDDFVFVRFEFYKDAQSEQPAEDYLDPLTGTPSPVFDKATYVENVSLRRTRSSYKIRLTSKGIPPEFRALSTILKEPRVENKVGDLTVLVAEVANEGADFHHGVTPNPKTVYVYRNGFQGRDSWGGKNVDHETERLTFVYDFSYLSNWQRLLKVLPQACIKRADAADITPLPVTWRNGIAICEAFKLRPGDRVRVYWTWDNALVRAGGGSCVTAAEAMS